jgi:hypothetical protein
MELLEDGKPRTDRSMNPVAVMRDPDATRYPRPVVLRGRDADPRRPDEITINEFATMENVYSPPIGALNEPIALAAQNLLAGLGS